MTQRKPAEPAEPAEKPEKSETRKKPPIDFDQLSDTALVRITQIVGPLVPVSRATWWRYVQAGTAPRPVKLGPGITAWRVGELRAWLARGVS